MKHEAWTDSPRDPKRLLFASPPSPWPRRLLVAALVLAAIAAGGFITGCAGFAPDPYGWESAPSHAPLRPHHLTVPSSDIARACRGTGWAIPFACAHRLPAEGLCIIYTEPSPPAWIMEHELKHCEGFDHDAPR